MKDILIAEGAQSLRLIYSEVLPRLLEYPSLDERGEGATEKNLIHDLSDK